MSKHRDGLTRLERKRLNRADRERRIWLVKIAGSFRITPYSLYLINAFNYNIRIPRRLIPAAEKAINKDYARRASLSGYEHHDLCFGWHKMLGGKSCWNM